MRLKPGLLDQVFEGLRRCGDRRRECVVYFSGPLEEPGVVDQFHHPEHSASAGGYDVDDAWVTQFFVDLAAGQRELRLQAHTHPGHAYHSSRDDLMALGYFRGYLSLVIPRFAEGRVSLDGAHLAVRQANGGWSSVDPKQEVEWS